VCVRVRVCVCACVCVRACVRVYRDRPPASLTTARGCTLPSNASLRLQTSQEKAASIPQVAEREYSL
jgi:hypothetical protein